MVTSSPTWPAQVTVVDVTPRDGLQDADHFVQSEQKLAFINSLLDAGVKAIEATSFMHPKWIPQLADADYVASHLPQHAGVLYSALIPNMRGYERARAANIQEVVLVVSASESHNRANLNRSIEESLAQLREVAARARHDGMPVRGAIATAFGCPFEGKVDPEAVLRIVQAYAEMGVQMVSLADTIGVGNPYQVFTMFQRVRQELPEHMPLAAHFHDREGYGLANVFAALQAGVTTFDAAIGGLGGCPYAPGAPGNLSTETLVEYLEAMGFATGISLTKLAAARKQLLEDLARGEPVTTGHSMRR
jgi:hydroxymethylglutaryl-CoA lyase